MPADALQEKLSRTRYFVNAVLLLSSWLGFKTA